MVGPGFGFSAGRGARRRRSGAPTPTPTGPTASFTMTQLAAANRIYQRISATGGGESKGQGVIRVSISASQAGSVQARCRSAADGTTILQAPWDAGMIATTGAQTLDVTGVDARLDWFYLDLLDSSGTWKQGSTPVGMGALIAMGGQSLMSRFLGRVDGEDSATLASLGIVPSAFGRAFVKYTDGGTHEATAWERPADATQSTAPTSAGVAELLNLRIAALGVNCGVIGYAKGATAIGTWQAGQSDGIELATVIANAGGAFESFFWFQGHGDAVYGTSSYAQYQAALTSFFGFVGSLNARSFTTYMAAIPNIDGWNWGDRKQRSEIRKAQQDWCAEHSAAYLGFADLELIGDAIHERQAGARRIARHLHRAMLAETSAANDAGPRVTAAAKNGRDIMLAITHSHGATLVGLGAAATRFLVTRAGDPNGDASAAALPLDASTPITLSASQIALKLASDPGAVPLEIWPMGVHPDANGAASGIYDDDDAESLGNGRQLFASPAPVRTRISTPLETAVSGLVTGYGPGRFGQGRATGEMQSSYAGLIGHPFAGLTMEMWATPTSLSTGGIKVLAGQGLGVWIGVNDAHFQYQVGDAAIASVTSHSMTAGQSHHVRLCVDPGGRNWRFYVNGTLQSEGSGTPAFGIGYGFAIGGFGGVSGVYHYTQGVIDEVALFNRALSKADFTLPSAAWLGTEPDLLHLWHCNGDGADTAI
jgi:hypothetical protein